MIEEQLRSGAVQTQQLSSSLADSLAKGARAAVVISQLSATSRRQAETIAKLRDEMARVRAGRGVARACVWALPASAGRAHLIYH